MGSVSVSSCRCCMFVSCVHPVAVLNAAFCMTCSLLMLVEDAIGDHTEEAYSRAGCSCSVVFGTLVGVFVFSVMWSELLMTSAISCPLWSSVYECQRVECAFTSPVRTECGMFVMYCMQCCMSVSAVL